MIKTILKLFVSLISLALSGCANKTRECILRGDSCIVQDSASQKKADVSVSFRLVDADTGGLLADETIPALVEFFQRS